MDARTGASIALLLAMVETSAANQPADPKPERSCSPKQLEHVALFSCPAGTAPYVACPQRLDIDMAGSYVSLTDAVQEWCVPDDAERKGSRYKAGVSPFLGGPARGPYIAWYANGTKAHEGRFPIRGVWTKWHANGVRSSVKDYGPDGRLRGRTTEWYANGRKAFTGSYARDMRTGPWLWWTEAGKLQEKGSYAADQEEGRWMRYHPNGRLRIARDYHAGRENGRWVQWYPDGTKQLEARCRDGSLHGRIQEWGKDGKKLVDRIARDSAVVCFE